MTLQDLLDIAEKNGILPKDVQIRGTVGCSFDVGAKIDERAQSSFNFNTRKPVHDYVAHKQMEDQTFKNFIKPVCEACEFERKNS